MGRLTLKQEKFCQEYVRSGNASKSYKVAYSSGNMSENGVYVNASKLLKNTKVALRLQQLNKKAVSSAVMEKQEALELLSAKARIKMTDVCDFKQALVGQDENGEPVYQTVWTMKNAEDIAPEVAACIKSVTVTRAGPKIELYDANASKKLLADMLGWNAPVKTEMSGELTTKNEWHIHPTSPVPNDQ